MEQPHWWRRNSIVFGIVLIWVLWAGCPNAFALNPELDVSQYAHSSWKIRDGFTKGQISSLAQTADGYLWLGTGFGLFRFDGMRNVPWQPPTGQVLPSNFIMSLLTARDGTLWIGTDKGLVSWSGGRLTPYPAAEGHFIFALCEDRQGTIWVGASSVRNGKLFAIRQGRLESYGADGTLGKGVFNVYEDRKGNLWVTVPNGIWRWQPGPAAFLPLPDEIVASQQMIEDHNGELILSLGNGIKRLVNGRLKDHRLPGVVSPFRHAKMLRDREGGLWLGTSTGLIHVHQGRTDLFSVPDGLSGESVNGLFEDREGNIWAATANGLDRFRDVPVPTFSVKQGLANSFVNSVLSAQDGSLLLTTASGVNRWREGHITIFDNGGRVPDRKTVPQSLFQDRQGTIWAVTVREFGYLENERFVPINGIPGGVAWGMGEDAAEHLWIANQDAGLLELSHGSLVQQIPWTRLGHQDFASSLLVDPVQGGLWLGFFKGGLIQFKDGQVRASYTVADGLGEGLVSDLRLEPDGTLWVATAGGLSRLKQGRVVTMTQKNGLPCNEVQWVREDQAHSFWMYTACGLVRIARPELDAWTAAMDLLKEPPRPVQLTFYDITEGVSSRAYPLGYYPQVAESPDGKLWFPGVGGVSVVNPQHLPFNRLPPPIQIEQMIADHQSYDLVSLANGTVSLPTHVRDLEIDYTALSLVAPEKTLFRYKLEGHDSNWQEVGTRRQAFFNDLPPGSYRFRVMACNTNGVWNEAGTFLDFSIAPAYYQTSWFRFLGTVAFLLLVGTLYQLRLRQVAQHAQGCREARMAERERDCPRFARYVAAERSGVNSEISCHLHQNASG
ncbi:MAG: hypothetical protein K1Y36_08860 [Blastocatellia bacterium]|nr:hypothetical protein [Blastocatellia bacterium]